ncbi:hypothetical protein RZS08_16525, partial [Arthrospira platensis SPKY1]|nr:hypothetical protein [Arthrospira platensis SPKY1]
EGPRILTVLRMILNTPDLFELRFFPQHIRHTDGRTVIGLGELSLHVESLQDRQGEPLAARENPPSGERGRIQSR